MSIYHDILRLVIGSTKLDKRKGAYKDIPLEFGTLGLDRNIDRHIIRQSRKHTIETFYDHKQLFERPHWTQGEMEFIQRVNLIPFWHSNYEKKFDIRDVRDFQFPNRNVVEIHDLCIILHLFHLLEVDNDKAIKCIIQKVAKGKFNKNEPLWSRLLDRYFTKQLNMAEDTGRFPDTEQYIVKLTNEVNEIFEKYWEQYYKTYAPGTYIEDSFNDIYFYEVHRLKDLRSDLR